MYGKTWNSPSLQITMALKGKFCVHGNVHKTANGANCYTECIFYWNQQQLVHEIPFIITSNNCDYTYFIFVLNLFAMCYQSISRLETSQREFWELFSCAENLSLQLLLKISTSVNCSRGDQILWPIYEGIKGECEFSEDNDARQVATINKI